MLTTSIFRKSYVGLFLNKFVFLIREFKELFELESYSKSAQTDLEKYKSLLFQEDSDYFAIIN